MAERLTREQLKGLTAEEKIAYQSRLNAARVAAYRARTGPTQGGPRAAAWQVPLDFHPRHCPPRFPPGLARPVTAGPVPLRRGALGLHGPPP